MARKRVDKELPEGVESWYSLFHARGAPRLGEAGYRAGPSPATAREAAKLYRRLLALWEDEDAAPTLQMHFAYEFPDRAWDTGDERDEDWRPEWSMEELADIAGLRPKDFEEMIWTVGQGPPHGELSGALVMEILYEFLEAGTTKPRLCLVSKLDAERFVKRHHSAFDDWNFRGLLYTIGVRKGARLVAVATVNTPSGGVRGRLGCPVDGMIDLSRIASDGTVKGASSMLASRVLDLLPVSGRRGAPGCLLSTFSLLSEAGTTYLSLADKGLRPTHITTPKAQSTGTRKGSVKSKPDQAKIAWQAGPAAAPADWSVLEDVAQPKQLAGARKQFELYEKRWAKEQKRLAMQSSR